VRSQSNAPSHSDEVSQLSPTPSRDGEPQLNPISTQAKPRLVSPRTALS
jgi:hypothetical protein